MEFLIAIWNYVIPFILVLTVLVFVHELGHYLAARRCGVRVEVFSIGFGPEIFGFDGKGGTRWKFSAIPFGGYVRMFGERAPDSDTGEPPLSDQDIEVSFFRKSLGQRAWIVFAGPLANFLFAIVVLAGLFCIVGQPYTPADVGKVVPGSAAEEAGLKPGDIFLKIDSTRIERFEQVRRIVQLSPGRRLSMLVKRDGQEVSLVVIPKAIEVTQFGSKQTIGRLGVSRTGRDMVFVRHDPFTAIWEATVRTFVLTGNILDALGQIISGKRKADELGGPVRIAQISGDMAQAGIVMVVQFAAILSINLGLINLFPIPLLDGGHLVFYGIEALRGRPVGERAMEYSLNIGLALILCLTIFVTWNDLVQLRFVEYVIGLVT
ncbi:MAG: RIP metalloprotease RseP [Rhodospirillaceae bacterium]|nr:RIP metalloprotease RseP [Rhodospirillaceae bacterium]|tara:strand:+ start:55543 stop:56673 length:1131 start_codon:yes stop_codon:yes gene_type:complete